MKVITAPQRGKLFSPSLFLAGGITDCPDWQDEAIAMLRGSPLTVVNPRRPDWPEDDQDGEISRQIR